MHINTKGQKQNNYIFLLSSFFLLSLPSVLAKGGRPNPLKHFQQRYPQGGGETCINTKGPKPKNNFSSFILIFLFALSSVLAKVGREAVRHAYKCGGMKTH
jgi:hypothetical protein